MNQKPNTIPHSLLAATVIVTGTATAGNVTLLPDAVNQLDSNTTSYSDANVTLTPLQGGVPATFNANAVRLGIDDFGTNVNAFNDPDTDATNGNGEEMRFEFAANAGLTGLSWDFARADGPSPDDGINISGFTSDPGVSIAGPGASASYSNGTVNIQLTGAAFVGTDGVLTLSNPGASAGATLLMTVADTTQAGAQFPITSISYEDAVPTKAPVLDPPLPPTLSPGVGVSTTLTASLEPGTAPGPSYVWEFDDGGGFVQVATTESYTFVAGPAADGDYRVTVTNAVGSDTATIAVTAIDDGDGIDNQWEVDNFGDFQTYGATDDVDQPTPDGLDNAGEFAAGTDPNNPDTDGDGLLDGDEAANNADPLVADTDGDGFSDGYEVNTAGTAANDPNDAPLVDSGRNSIGVTFASAAGNAAGINLGPLALAGAPGFVQKNWNATGALPQAQTSTSESDIVTPSGGTLVDSSGSATAANFIIGSAGTFSRLNNPDQSISGLYSGYLFATAASPTALIDIADIPYARYDIVFYVMGFSQNVAARIAEINSGLEYGFRTPAILPAGSDPVWFRGADQTNASNGTFENYPVSTHVIFRGLSGTDQSFDLNQVTDNGGIAAFQIIEDLDTDGDGMGDNYEISVGLDPNDDGTTDPVKEGANGDFDGDGILNIDEHDDGTNPTDPDTDGDGYTDDVETDTGIFVSTSDTGTDPRLPDFDGDGLLDGVETNTGIFVDANDTGTDPLVANFDTDQDGWSDEYEVGAGGTNLADPEDPGGPNPTGFAIGFNAIAGVGGGPTVEFGPLVYAGAPGVEQKNWNRTIDLANNTTDASGTIAKIATPNAGEIVDSAGNVIGDAGSGVGVTFTAGFGAYSSFPDNATPYGRLYNSFIYGRSQEATDASITLTGIPYANYDVYVYFGSETNGRTGTISSSAAGTTYSFTTQVVDGSPGTFLQTTDTGSGNPAANYAVFSGQSGGTFDVTVTPGALQNSMGIYGIQVVEAAASGDPTLTLSNPQISGTVFTADFTTDTAGTFILERSETLNNDWIQIGSSFSVGVGTSQVTDPSAPATKAFYRVSEP
ncbi:hypothetical protein HAHE_36100 [Haloferula helveola]|uniref:PKD domain-containing protein n=1 Tax=Haloferula helveola TaxID=490095 RepID=A0ABM7RIC3_9BACT|nr:hypothetical protein HAHE_36100 [Haloferula helveola]